MDQGRMDVEGGRVLQREPRARKLAVVVAMQNALVAACLVVTLYVYWWVCDQEDWTNVHIQLRAINNLSGNKTLQFPGIHGANMMSLADENKQKISVNCTGPYVLYVDLCYKSIGEEVELGGTLQLEVEGRTGPVSAFPLRASSEVCRGLCNIVYLRAKERASLRLYAEQGFRIDKITVGLSYLLGTAGQCFY